MLGSFLLVLSSFVMVNAASSNPVDLISPAVKFEKILGVNQWFPGAIKVESDAPKITGKAAFFVETKNGEVLYSKNIEEKLPIASLAKVMTVLIALEQKSLDDKFIVSAQATEMEPDKMFLKEGEKLTLRELLEGIFLISANDAAEVLAEETTGNRAEFLDLMNAKAKQIGMNNTYFVNPTGLDEDEGSSYSTAYDLAILTRYLIKRFPQIVEISETEHVFIPQTEEHQDYDMYSGINLLTTYPGVVGFKTGYTPQAGYTLITLAQKSGYEIVGILLNSESRRNEARELLDYSFKKLGS